MDPSISPSSNPFPDDLSHLHQLINEAEEALHSNTERVINEKVTSVLEKFIELNSSEKQLANTALSTLAQHCFDVDLPELQERINSVAQNS